MSSSSSSNSHVPIEPPTSIRRCPRRFPSQARGLLIRTWHVQRRQRCRLFLSFILGPFLIVVFAILARSLDNRRIEALPNEQNPTAAFVARPLDAAQCPRLRLIGQESVCFQDPFVPKPFRIPFAVASTVNPSDVGSVKHDGCEAQSVALGQCLTQPQDLQVERAGLLGGLSLSPFILPEVVNGTFNEMNTEARDLVFLNAVLGRNRFAGADLDEDLFRPEQVEFAYNFFRFVEGNGTTDAAYRTQTEQFGSREDMLDNIFDVWSEGTVFSTYYSAYFFKEYSENSASSSLTMDVTAFYNESSSSNCTLECDLTSSIIRLSNAAYQRLMPENSASVYLRRYPKVDGRESLGFVQLVLSVVIGLQYHFLFPGFLRFLVYERSSKLRDMMQMMGLKPLNYWIVTYLGLLAEYGVFAILLMIEGFAAGVQFYTNNAIVGYVVLFFLWGNVMIALAMFLSPFFENPEPALMFGWFYTIITSFIGGPFLGRLLASDEPESTWYAVQLLPSFAFLRSVYYMGAFNAGGKGVTVGDEFFGGTNLKMCGPGPLCRSYVFLLVEWIVLVVLGLYLDRVLPGATGIRSHPLFFLGFQRDGTRGCFGKKRSVATDDLDTKAHYGEGEDVVAEQARARELVQSGAPSGIVIDNLHKVYPTRPPVYAVNGLSLIAKRNEVCGILGGNGAGKTTTFKVITGEHEPTSGNVYVNGHNVRSDSVSIQEDLGLCPQHDRQWRELTGEEHLYFYARIKLIAPKDLKACVDAALESVQLTFARKRKVSEYSGGMRRRLSVAISFMGEPSLIVLDEPTTGLDPKSRRKVWECIHSHKAGKTILLTTHSLEEAETLCDRTGIMAYGRLKCIGRPDELKLRLGRGYRLTFSLPESNIKDLHALLTGLSQEATFETALAGNVVYTLPNQVALSTLFKAIQDNKERLGIRDWGVTQSSLEDVFIDISKQQQQYMEKTLQTPEV